MAILITVYQDPRLPEDLIEILDIPGVWEVQDVVVGVPPTLTYPLLTWGWGPNWAGFPLVPASGEVYLFPQEDLATPIRGCVWDGGASVMVCPGEPARVLSARLIHELLHLLDDGRHDPDGMDAWLETSRIRSFAYTITTQTGLLDRTAWERIFYESLMNDWKKGGYTECGNLRWM